jgi:hypothetical protein
MGVDRIGLANKRGIYGPQIIFTLKIERTVDTFSSASLSSSEELSSDDSSLALPLPSTPGVTLTALKLNFYRENQCLFRADILQKEQS